MSTDRQIAANRGNAKLSTGPKTVLGKRLASKNSRKHGLYGELPPEVVLAHYRVFVDDPEASPPASGASRLEECALKLAQAAVRLSRVMEADYVFYERVLAAIRKRENGAIYSPEPIFKAAGALRGVSDVEFLEIANGNLSAIPITALPLWSNKAQSIGKFGLTSVSSDEAQFQGIAPHLLAEDLVSLVDGASNGKLPQSNLRLRVDAESSYRTAFREWLSVLDSTFPETEPIQPSS